METIFELASQFLNATIPVWSVVFLLIVLGLTSLIRPQRRRRR